MKVIKLSLLSLLVASTAGIAAQGTPVPATNDTDAVETTDMTIDDLTKDDKKVKKMKKKEMMADGEQSGTMLEFGIRPSYSWIAGDVDATGGYGVGLHFRKSLDHLFSIRVDGVYAATSGDNETGDNSTNRRFESRMTGGSVLGVVTLNNFRYSGDTRNTNIYAMVGGGANTFKTDAQRNAMEGGGVNGIPFDEDDTLDDNSRNKQIERAFNTHAAAGAGIAFRISPKFNIGLEYQVLIPFGKRADQLDGYVIGGTFRDVQNFGSVSLNFNLGNKSKKAEPAYWTNAFTAVREDMSSLNSRVDDATKDSDGDGVVDAVDQEANTPAGVPVDTRGRVLDSDKDGVPDYKDFEPFFPPRAGETVDANGVVNNRNDKPITEDRVQEMIDASLARVQAGNEAGTTRVVTDRGEIFLPMIYFPLGQSKIKFADYGTLSSVARVLQGNPGMRMVIRGYTDRVGNAANNQVLSYRRAESVVNHLVNQAGIDRSRLILQYRGEENAIVPLDKSYINRRVEFLTAEPGESEDAAPAGAGGRGGY